MLSPTPADLPVRNVKTDILSSLEPIRITRSIAAGCKVRCLRCRVKVVLDVALATPAGILPRRLVLGLFARPHNDPVFRIGSFNANTLSRPFGVLCFHAFHDALYE